jgi:hypothetical protein
MVLYQSFLCKRPESLNTVDIYFSLFELMLMIDVEMPKHAEHKGIMSPFVSIDDRSSSYAFHCLLHQ